MGTHRQRDVVDLQVAQEFELVVDRQYVAAVAVQLLDRQPMAHRCGAIERLLDPKEVLSPHALEPIRRRTAVAEAPQLGQRRRQKLVPFAPMGQALDTE